MRAAVGEVAQQRRLRGRATGDGIGDEVEVLVVALDPEEGAKGREVLAVVARDIADLDPEGHIRMSRHDGLDRVERPVDVAERSDLHGRIDVARRQERASRAYRPPWGAWAE